MTASNRIESTFRLESVFPEDERPFASYDEIESWLRQEEEMWACLDKPRVNSDFHSRVSSGISRIRQAINAQKQTNQDQDSDASVQHALAQWKSSGPKFTSRSIFGQLVCNLAVIDTDLAAAAAMAMLEHHDKDNNRRNSRNPPQRAVGGEVIVTLFNLGLLKDHVSNVEPLALTSIKEDWKSFFRGLQEKWAALAQSAESKTASVSSQIAVHEEKLSELIVEAESRLNKHESTYYDRLALQSPVRYWKKRAAAHRRNSWIFAVLFSALLAAGVFSIYMLCRNFVLPQLEQAADGENRLWVMGLLLLAAGAVAWPLRLAARLLMSNIHLGTDAEERVTMANVYLSLLRRDGAIAEDDRQLILSSLFRSAATGIVKEDGSPTSSVDMLSRLFSGR